MSHQRHSRLLITYLLLLILLLTACDNSPSTPTPTSVFVGCSVDDLIAAINQANSTPGPAVINLGYCLYTLTEVDNSAPVGPIMVNNGLPVITSKITIMGNLAVIEIQKDPGEPDFGHFFVAATGDLEIYDMVISDGVRPIGGAVVNKGGNFFASNTNFIDNTASPMNITSVAKGGAIYSESGWVRLINGCLIQDNHAGDPSSQGINFGGAIYNKDGALLVSNATFILNRAEGSGGAIYTVKSPSYDEGGPITIYETDFYENEADLDGGAIALINEMEEVLIVNSLFNLNRADNNGGSIYSEGTELVVNYTNLYTNFAQYGGAIYTKRTAEEGLSVLTSESTEYKFNEALIGGAIFSENSDLALEDDLFAENSAESCGAIRNGGRPFLDVEAGDLETAVRVDSSSEITVSNFNDNQATQKYGGALCHIMGDLEVGGTTFLSNQSQTYGGALLIMDQIEMVDSAILGNSSSIGGGAAIGQPQSAMAFDEGTVVSAGYLNFQATLDGCGLSINQAEGHGGGIYADHGGAVRVSKTTFDSNTANVLGGGIFQKEGDLFITNSTLSGNVAQMGGGIRLISSASAGYVLDINHTTIAFNTATDNSPFTNSGGGGINITGGNANINNSLVIFNFSKDCSLVSKQFISGADNVDSYDTCGFNQFFGLTVPLIGSLSGNTHPILPGSPLIDLLPNCGEPDDQRGVPRPQGTACDPGSYEFDPANPPPPPPASGPESSSSLRCDLFDDLEFSLVLMNIPRETTNLTLYFKMLGGVPGLELEIPDDPNPWIYRALLGQTESVECSFQGYESRLYCTFVLPETALGSAQDLLLYLNECDDPILSQPRVSIPEAQLPKCSKDLGEEACLAAGGTYHPGPLTAPYCECP